ncbi:hypothetical protein BFS30_08740 [Pedobacter steynii]|uniref:FAS1 domain-containing protein n=2 Tax=Pedobacter steynii TaxID=430522 RepID=A0A1D7QF61_9SPHI|nr:hypothetical protein BFS30_08740 [Pedobacter steynii]
MMKQYSLKFMVFLLLVLNLACKHERVVLFAPNLNLRPAGEFINNNYEFKLFNAALKITGLSEILNGQGPFTVFAPSDLAFNNMGIRTPADFQKMNLDSLRDVMKYHIVTQRMSSMDVAKKTVDNPFNTLLGHPVLLSLGNDTDYDFYINGSRITRKDIDLANGILNTVDKVIKYQPVTVKKYLESQERYGIFVAALKKFGLLDQLDTEGPWTVLALPNSAFEQQNISKEDIEKLNPASFKKRLFGTYIFKLQFFRSDLLILTKSGGSGEYDPSGAAVRVPIPGDEEYSHGMAGYNLFVIKTDYGNYPIVRETTTGPADRIDLLFKNGIIHEAGELVIYPEEALIRP